MKPSVEWYYFRFRIDFDCRSCGSSVERETVARTLKSAKRKIIEGYKLSRKFTKFIPDEDLVLLEQRPATPEECPVRKRQKCRKGQVENVPATRPALGETQLALFTTKART